MAPAPTSGTRPDIDLLDPAFYLDDPHAAFTWMRQHEPVYRDTANDLWAVTRHRDVHDVEGRSDVFVSGRGYRSFWAPDETNMIALDDPEHAAQRGLVARRFTPKAVREHEAWIRATVRSLLDAVVDDGRMEVVDALGAQLPCRLTARLLGWPEERWRDVKSWSERLMQYDRLHVDPAAAAGMIMAIGEFSSELPAMARERREAAAAGCPFDDLLAVWSTAVLDGPDGPWTYDDMRLVHETGLVISGGAETTRTVITRGLHTFTQHPDQWELLASRPELIPRAVDELVRWITPLHNFFRTASRDTDIGDQAIAEGDRLVLCYASANRDEDAFTEPFRFDVNRHPNPHLGFGFGTHFCLGASLARLELTIVLEELVPRITDLEALAPPVDEPNVFAWAVGAFELGYAPAQLTPGAPRARRLVRCPGG